MKKFSGWPRGMDNIHSDTEIAADSLRRAVNVDVHDGGNLTRRKGYTQVLAVPNAHSFYSKGDSSFFVADNTMYRFFPDGTAMAIGTVPTGTNRVHYETTAGATFFTSKTARGKIVNDALDDWGVEVPLSVPTVVATVGAGTLRAGTYHAVVTYVLADGRESGASASAMATLTADGAIIFTGMPIPTQPGVVSKRVYMTQPDGDQYYNVATVGAGASVAGVTGYGAELRTRLLSPPPYGTAIASTLGRIFIASGKFVRYTDALDYEHVNLWASFYQFPADVTVIAGVGDGLYVCADKTYFIAGAGDKEARSKEIADFGAFPGTLSYLPNSLEPIWFTERGAVIGGEGGSMNVVSVSLKAGEQATTHIHPGKMVDAASMVREEDGVRQFVVVGQQTEASSLQCGSYAEAEIIRRAQ